MAKWELSQPANGNFVFRILENNLALSNKIEDPHNLHLRIPLGMEFSLTGKQDDTSKNVKALLIIGKKVRNT